ncbi:hypothetical protein N9K85_05710 [Flavobacteriaceae bacterium]|nr:hypothetical protein [Flavobacteriaceae bacterium]
MFRDIINHFKKMKKIVLLVTTLILSCFNLTAQDEKTTDLVGYGGGQYEVFKTGGQESIELWFLVIKPLRGLGLQLCE